MTKNVIGSDPGALRLELRAAGYEPAAADIFIS
jgi:hypothetical protein